MNIGKNILVSINKYNAARNLAGKESINQKKLAELTGISPVMISRLVNNKFKKNKPDLLEKIANVLEVDINKFYK